VTHPHFPARWQASVVLMVGHLIVGVLHVWPRLVYPQRAQTTKVVLALNQIGPVWITAFGLTGLGLLVALRTHKLLHIAHILAGGVWVMYCFALEVGAIASGGTHLLPVATALLACVHFVLAGSYSRDLGRRPA
jgi:hypothetical protein